MNLLLLVVLFVYRDTLLGRFAMQRCLHGLSSLDDLSQGMLKKEPRVVVMSGVSEQV